MTPIHDGSGLHSRQDIEAPLVDNLGLRRYFLSLDGHRVGVQEPLNVYGGQNGQRRQRYPSHCS